MKKFLAIILASLLLCPLTGCSEENNSINNDSTQSDSSINNDSTDKTGDNDSSIPEALKRKNEISYYTNDEVKKIIKEEMKLTRKI